MLLLKLRLLSPAGFCALAAKMPYWIFLRGILIAFTQKLKDKERKTFDRQVPKCCSNHACNLSGTYPAVAAILD